MENILYHLNFDIRTSHVYKDGKLTLPSLLNFLQEAAGKHADKLKFGVHDLNISNDTWVLSRMRVEIVRWPEIGENIMVETWPKGFDRLFAIRDFRVYDSKGEILVKAASYWLVVDRISKRPKMMTNISKELINPEISAIDQKLGKIPVSKSIDFNFSKKVMSSEIDVNGHVNNVHYSEWVFNTLPAKILKKRKLICYEINYMAEVFVDEKVEVELGWDLSAENLMLGSVKRGDKEVCRVKLLFDA